MFSEIHIKSGFSLLELLLVVALASLITGSAYLFYTSQVKTKVTQQQVVEIQQNLRAAMAMMGDDIRMAGYDPAGNTGAAILQASADTMSFSIGLDGDTNGLDDDGDGHIDETDEAGLADTVRYFLADDEADGDSDIFRSMNGGAAVMIAENVEGWEFNYTMEDGSFKSATTQTDEIIAVRLAILVRAVRPDRDFTNGSTYTGYARTWGPFDDGYRRRLLRRTIRCRNRGI